MHDPYDNGRTGLDPVGYRRISKVCNGAPAAATKECEMFGRRRRERELADARADAQRWHERLGGQVMNLPPGDDPATKQALIDAGERYNAAGSQLERATSVKQYDLARETALEGLAYVRAARTAMNLDPGPELPMLAGQREAGEIRQAREVEVQGRNY